MDEYDVASRQQTITRFGDLMFGIRKELYSLNDANSHLADRMKEVFDRDGFWFAFYTFTKKIGFSKTGEEGINKLLRKRPAALQFLMNQQHMLLDKRIDSTHKYMSIVAEERNRLLYHTRYLHEEARRLITGIKTIHQNEEHDRRAYDEMRQILIVQEEQSRNNIQNPDLEMMVQDAREKEIAQKLRLEETQRTAQNLHIRKNTLYNAAASGRLLVEQMDLCYAQVDLMRETLESQRDYTRTIVEGQIALGLVLEDLEKVVEHYADYRKICNKLLAGINVGLQTILQEVIKNTQKPFYDIENLQESATINKESRVALESYRKTLKELATNSGSQYQNIHKLLHGLDLTVQKLQPYAPREDVRSYEQLIVQ